MVAIGSMPKEEEVGVGSFKKECDVVVHVFKWLGHGQWVVSGVIRVVGVIGGRAGYSQGSSSSVKESIMV